MIEISILIFIALAKNDSFALSHLNTMIGMVILELKVKLNLN